MWQIVPRKLKKWSRIATVSSSWWWPWIFGHRYNTWVKQLKDEFWVEIIEMENTLKSPNFVSNNPKARAEDLMNAFLDPNINWIISTIWWNDSIRMLPYIDFEIIKNNPKVFMGYSDTTVSHFICHKAWIRSYYWPAIMAWFAENWWLHEYMKDSVRNTLFSSEIIWEIKPNSDWWTNEFLDWWDANNWDIKRKLQKNTPWRFLQWDGIIEWELLGWCMDVLYFMWWTPIWPEKEEWNWKILFIETSEESISEINFERILRTMWIQWIFHNISGIIMWRSVDGKNYDQNLLNVINGEFWLDTLPIVTNMDFWHTDPMFVLPIWAKMTIDFNNKKVLINESWAL